eukprot:CAMPEP_0181246576 /NCGR_PEP_ID=MMETSP1096-20121128/44077_1 /TAXON_ID=156174 ORGANISM="Chrysochromulina ericina, Strain CCMP281" /NCGR_SAMPLE_ID=MMETSP1096 /ASSEMBLY_ACC=CAM_ASM_000453 /LENGTH=237 /DNA_ID=CAMNT_0023343421 /DNA_START=729 /DNA_END=1442 /DNA_ORIENTATION=+
MCQGVFAYTLWHATLAVSPPNSSEIALSSVAVNSIVAYTPRAASRVTSASVLSTSSWLCFVGYVFSTSDSSLRRSFCTRSLGSVHTSCGFGGSAAWKMSSCCNPKSQGITSSSRSKAKSSVRLLERSSNEKQHHISSDRDLELRLTKLSVYGPKHTWPTSDMCAMDFSLGVSRSRGEKGESPPGRGEDGSAEEDELLRVADTARGTSGLVGSTGACHLRVAPSSARNSIFRTRLLRL